MATPPHDPSRAASKDGQFSLSPAVDEAQRNIQRPMTSILLEAGRRMDEAGGAAG